MKSNRLVYLTTKQNNAKYSWIYSLCRCYACNSCCYRVDNIDTYTYSTTKYCDGD